MINKLNGTIISQGYCLPERDKELINSSKRHNHKNKPIDLIKPNGEFISYKTTEEAEIGEGISKHSLRSLLSGEAFTCFGYRLQRSVKIVKIKEWQAILISPDGEEVCLNGIEPFIRMIKPATGKLVKKLLLGQTLEYKGWKLKE